MSSLVEYQSLEAEIVDCCQAIYQATDPQVALSNWTRLRKLTAQRDEEETSLFIRESLNHTLNDQIPAGQSVKSR